jgi:hypothetical protein
MFADTFTFGRHIEFNVVIALFPESQSSKEKSTNNCCKTPTLVEIWFPNLELTRLGDQAPT